MTRCPACCSKMVENIYSPGPQPLMALGLPRSEAEAKSKPLYPMNYYECAFCGHVFNADFDYAKVPYEDDSNLMFNKGSGWRDHIEAMARLLSNSIDDACDPGDATVIDIGAGDGDFLRMVKAIHSYRTREPKCIAFEPGIEARTCRAKGLETVADYFVPQRDLSRSKPTHLSCRHVLEHLQEPRDFVAEIAYYANKYKQCPIMFAEVPCITKGLRDRRIGDFLYEHVGNFTERSLRVMFDSAGWRTYRTGLAYNDEVVYWIGDTRGTGGVPEPPNAEAFRRDVWTSATNVMAALASLRQGGYKTVYWGGTGKGAAFLNAYQITDGFVVDSDKNKVDLYVPGTGQKIESPDTLVEYPVHTIIITTRWRAADIYAEIYAKGIEYDQLLVLDGSALREYTKEDYEQEA